MTQTVLSVLKVADLCLRLTGWSLVQGAGSSALFVAPPPAGRSLTHLSLRELLKDQTFFYVPDVIEELSGSRVLTTTLVPGFPLDKATDLSQGLRNEVRAAPAGWTAPTSSRRRV